MYFLQNHMITAVFHTLTEVCCSPAHPSRRFKTIKRQTTLLKKKFYF